MKTATLAVARAFLIMSFSDLVGDFRGKPTSRNGRSARGQRDSVRWS
jgi:hypothetical protein